MEPIERADLEDAGVDEPAAPLGVAIVASANEPFVEHLLGDLTAIGYVPVVVAISSSPDEAGPASIVFVALSHAVMDAVSFSQQVRRSPSLRGAPVVWVTESARMGELWRGDTLFDEFLEVPYLRTALEMRLRLLHRRSGTEDPNVLRRGSLVMNLSTYQAQVAGRSLELTYMEYELLRFLASTPLRVYTRQEILRNVWGYDYYGGMRTVDVHVRRLRAKLGQEHARLIETVRNVGYGFSREA